MCAVSQIYDYGQRTLPEYEWWKQFPMGPIQGGSPATDPMILQELRAQREILEKFIAMVEAGKKFDVAAHEPDCEDPTKAALMDQVMERLVRIEKALNLS